MLSLVMFIDLVSQQLFEMEIILQGLLVIILITFLIITAFGTDEQRKGDLACPTVGQMASELTLTLAGGLMLRLALMLYGVWQDATMEVPYTDVDYWVFTDAAEYVTQGKSPYLRATYRYTPLLAWLLTPNIHVSHHFGKLLFISADIVAGALIYATLRCRNYSVSTATLACQIWVLNPLPMAVSSRGNAESILAVLIIGMFYLMACQRLVDLVAAGFLYGLAVHMKIYPVTYALAAYLVLDESYTGKKSCWRRVFGLDIAPNKSRLVFCSAAAITFISSTAVCYYCYGREFIEHTYLYHVTRQDTRHNFSPYFYALYIGAETWGASLLGLAAFIPQVVLAGLISFKFHADLPFASFLLTFTFVTFNKVCTSQYFLWYLSILPLLVPQLSITLRKAAILLLLWFVGQALWLCPAYFLEFESHNTFLFIWTSGLVFLCINTWILCVIISLYSYRPTFRSGRPARGVQKQLPTLFEILQSIEKRLS